MRSPRNTGKTNSYILDMAYINLDVFAKCAKEVIL